jgi:hypothetical protein
MAVHAAPTPLFHQQKRISRNESSIGKLKTLLAARLDYIYSKIPFHFKWNYHGAAAMDQQRTMRSAVLAARKLYSPILEFQTRLIRLHGHFGIGDCALSCDLYTTTIPDRKFGGLIVCTPPDEKDFVVQYDALSYTWGDGSLTGNVLCNGVEMPISDNLSQALRALRQAEPRYLWVDAMCINQADDKEKSEQVSNILQIFERAATVIGWLGCSLEKGLEDLLSLAAPTASNAPDVASFDIGSLCSGLSYLYTRPWFQRIWIQQEIFAADRLRLQCQHHQFQWLPLLSEPRELLRHPDFKQYFDATRSKRQGFRNRYEILDTMFSGQRSRRSSQDLKIQFPSHMVPQLQTISNLHRLHSNRLICFERFTSKKDRPYDLIETLLYTGKLESTNPRDYVYGILGMVKFPHKPMSIQRWLQVREHETFIPIDYSADLTYVYTAVTWALIMNGGLGILAKFKVFAAETDATGDQSLPSWVIDWRLAARAFSHEKSRPSRFQLNGGLENAWTRTNVIRNSKATYTEFRPGTPPTEHLEFRCDNCRLEVPCTKLILRGIVDPRFYAEGNFIWARHREKWHLDKDEVIWQLDFEVFPIDIVVYIHAFVGAGYQHLYKERLPISGAISPKSPVSGGPWLLRPVGADEYRLMACLSWTRNEWRLLYHKWAWALNSSNSEDSSARQQRPSLRRFRKDPLSGLESYYEMPEEHEGRTEMRTFAIV